MKKIAKLIKRLFSILFSIYLIGTIGGVLVCGLLEPAGRIRFYNYCRLPLWEGKLIVASTHPGWLDVVILPLLYFPWWFRELLVRIRDLLFLPLKVLKKESVNPASIFSENFKDVPVSTPDKYNLRYFKPILEEWNIFINRGKDGLVERSAALKKAFEILENGGRIIIFPGGGRDYKAEETGKGIYDIKTRQLILRLPDEGIGWFIERTGATIVPVRIEGTDKVLPNWPNKRLPYFLRFERYFLRVWHPIIVKIGEPIRLPKGTPKEIVLQRYINAQLELFYEGR